MLHATLATQWIDLFPQLSALDAAHLALIRDRVGFKTLSHGEVAYRQGSECPAYVMCLEGRTRTFKVSESGREILLYRVGPGETCVLTTSCLLAQKTFPAESAAEELTQLAALPASVFHDLMSASAPFRRFVLDDYGQLIGSLITLVDEVAFASLDIRLARLLLAESAQTGVVHKTHQELALDLGSVREVVSRHLGEWERAGWIHRERGHITVADRTNLERYHGGGPDMAHAGR